MLYVKLQNIISEDEAINDPQRLFNDVENHEDAWVIIRNGKPSFVIASAKLIQNEESGTGLGGFEVKVQDAPIKPNQISPEINQENPPENSSSNSLSDNFSAYSEEPAPSQNLNGALQEQPASNINLNPAPVPPNSNSPQNNSETFYNPFGEPSNSNFSPIENISSNTTNLEPNNTQNNSFPNNFQNSSEIPAPQNENSFSQTNSNTLNTP